MSIDRSGGRVVLDLQTHLRVSMPRGAPVVVAVMSLCISKTISVLDMPRGAPAPLTEAPLFPANERGATARLGERGASKGALPGTGCLVPETGEIPGKEVAIYFGSVFLPGLFFVPCFGFPFVWKESFRGMEHSSPPGVYFPYLWYCF